MGIDDILASGASVIDDGAEDTLVANLEWFFYDFTQDLLGDTIETGEEQTNSVP